MAVTVKVEGWGKLISNTFHFMWETTFWGMVNTRVSETACALYLVQVCVPARSLHPPCILLVQARPISHAPWPAWLMALVSRGRTSRPRFSVRLTTGGCNAKCGNPSQSHWVYGKTQMDFALKPNLSPSHFIRVTRTARLVRSPQTMLPLVWEPLHSKSTDVFPSAQGDL